VIVRAWFRRQGHVDDLWWTLLIDGVERHASSISGRAQFNTEVMPGPEPSTPLLERRHVVSFDAEHVEWDGDAAIVS
jgi:hypothetical protein